MEVVIFDSRQKMAQAAADHAGRLIRQAIAIRGQAYLIAATGASQFEFLDALVVQPGIEWGQVTFFHLDEYVGLAQTHPSSFRRYLQERIVDRLQPGAFHFVNGDAPDPAAECRRVGELISRQTIDAAFVGIGENGTWLLTIHQQTSTHRNRTSLWNSTRRVAVNRSAKAGSRASVTCQCKPSQCYSTDTQS
jgi:glucosamine-6-phosphate deaminase